MRFEEVLIELLGRNYVYLLVLLRLLDIRRGLVVLDDYIFYVRMFWLCLLVFDIRDRACIVLRRSIGLSLRVSCFHDSGRIDVSSTGSVEDDIGFTPSEGIYVEFEVGLGEGDSLNFDSA